MHGGKVECEYHSMLNGGADAGACDGDDVGPGVNEALEVHGSYLPASMESWCLIYPFQVMKGLHLEVIDRWCL